MDAIFGFKAGGGSEIQAYRYRLSEGWEEGQARRHCTGHDGELFEPATNEEPEEESVTLNLKEFEKRLREADLKALEEYRLGKAEAPVLYKAEGRANKPESGKPMVFVASEESPDRHGDVIEVGGWELENFRKNPVLMFTHDYSIAPLGLVPKIWVEGKQLLNVVDWDAEDEFARFIKGKYERGFMRAQSVGFRPIEFEPIEKDKNKDDDDDGLFFFGPKRFKKQELVEISLVPRPMHPHALRKAMDTRKFGIVMPVQIPIEAPASLSVTSTTVGLDQVDSFNLELKAGAVLNKTNKDRLQQAKSLIDEVLISSEKPESQEDQVEEENALALIQDFVKALKGGG